MAEANPSPAATSGLTKAKIKAQRRKKQEEDRRRKAEKQAQRQKQAHNEEQKEKTEAGAGKTKSSGRAERSDRTRGRQPGSTHLLEKKFAMFDHLRNSTLTSPDIALIYPSLPEPVMKLGKACTAHDDTYGSNARCAGLIDVLQTVIRDFVTPENREFSRELQVVLRSSIQFLSACRPLSVSMSNAVRFLRWKIMNLPARSSENEGKDAIIDALAKFQSTNIDLARKAISELYASSKISEEDIILTLGHSYLLKQILLDAAKSRKPKQVIIVDARPRFGGRQMMHDLLCAGISCSYVMISGLSHVLPMATKVLLSADALLANGYVMGSAGNFQIALMAKQFNVPVLICCETYKFCERVQTDAFVYNELDNADKLISSTSPISGWRDNKNLQVLPLMYDVIPSELITMVITEIGMIPCSSVPVVVRVKHQWSEI